MQNPIRSFLLVLLTLIILFSTAIPVFAQNEIKPADKTVEITDDGISDNLSTNTDVRWYSFPVTVEGDAVIMFRSNGGSSQVASWEITFYDQDQSTILDSVYALKGITYLSAQDLTKGTYYVKVQSAKSATHHKFSSKQFSLKAITCASEQVKPSSNEICTVTKPGTLLWNIDGTLFIKAYEGEALVGVYTKLDGEAGPILVSSDVDNVAFFSSKGNWITSGHKDSYISYGERFDKTRYYISQDSGFVELSQENIRSAPLYQCGNGRRVGSKHAAQELLNVHFGKDPNEGLALKNFIVSPAFPIIAGAVIVLILIIVAVVFILIKTKRIKPRHRTHTATHSASTHTPTSPDNSGADWNGMPHVIDYNSMKDM